MSEVAPDETAYDLTGPPDAPCVVLIHGLGLSRALWDQHLPAFEGWRILRYDLYGHGESAPHPEPLTLTVFSNQIAGLMHTLGIDQAHIIGFSIGGMINRRFARDHPDKCLSLAILNSPHNRGPKAQAEVEARARAARGQGALATMDAALARWFTPAYLATGDGPTRVRNWRGLADANSYAQTAWVLAHGVRELTEHPGDIAAPTLVMTCENDSGSTPAMSHDMASEIPGARTIIVPHLQHLGLMEEPDAFTTPLLHFLAEQAQPAADTPHRKR